MNYKEVLAKKNEEIRERHELAMERIHTIAAERSNKPDDALGDYFRFMAHHLEQCDELYKKVADHWLLEAPAEELAKENASYYQDIFPDNYEFSYANPAYAVRKLGEEYGRILSFLYTQLRAIRAFAFEQDLYKFTIFEELFLEIHFMFESEDVAYKNIKAAIYDFFYDYADEFIGWRVRELVDPSLSYATDLVRNADPNDTRYLYYYGDYISDDETQMAEFLSSLPAEEITEIASTFTEGYKKGLALKGVDVSKKGTVDIRYNVGFERIIRESIQQFEAMGLKPVIYRAALVSLNKRQNIKIGYVSTSPNPQYDYDHRFDEAIYLDKRMVDRKVSCMRKAYEEYADLAAGYAGPACFEIFGEEPFEPVSKEEAYRLSERQQNLNTEYRALTNEMIGQFINQEERSFTIISFPIPQIGPKFPEIFEEIRKVNTLDNEKYQRIHQTIIDTLDQSVAVHILGRDDNMTNIMVSLHEITDPDKQTKFENCLADVNIPVGEVFTSPVLKGTTGLLHVTKVYLNGLCYHNLKLNFEDGYITDYSCTNFEDPEEGKKYIKENILFGHDTLPMGELAIGTNTTAYVIAKKYGIEDKLPILIAEKMGPHMAVGDTCYSYTEDVKVYNPDGKEIIARDNERSLERKTDPKKAYFNCHTDITIPYEELGSINAVTESRVEVPIILDGRFVLTGTLELNEPFDQDEEYDGDVEDLVTRFENEEKESTQEDSEC